MLLSVQMNTQTALKEFKESKDSFLKFSNISANNKR